MPVPYLQNVPTLPKLGQTWYATGYVNTSPTDDALGTTKLEGSEAWFEDLAPATAAGVRTKRSGRGKRCLFVRNSSAGALLPKRLVSWASGYRNRRVDGYVTVDFAEVAGVVDECLPTAGVPQNDLFWLTVEGQTLVKSSLTSDTITAGDKLVALTAATSGATTSGRVQSYAATSNTTALSDMDRNFIGFAISGKTSGETNKDLLADVKLI